MGFEEAQKYRDQYIQSKKDAGLQVSDRNGFYVSSTIKDQGKTGRLHTVVFKSALANSRNISDLSFTCKSVTSLNMYVLQGLACIQFDMQP